MAKDNNNQPNNNTTNQQNRKGEDITTFVPGRPTGEERNQPVGGIKVTEAEELEKNG